jgi:protein phosphatase
MMRYWALTDTGCVRPENQDAWHVRTVAGEGGTEILTAVVCDGMGGARAGNVASGLGVDLFTDTLCGELRTVDDAENAVPGAVAAANKAIYERSVSAEEYSGMGTTLVAAVTDGRKTLVVNIGDSRCYLIRDKLIRQITKDHSLVQDLVDRGEIDRADAWLHPQRNYITRALGTDETVEADRFHLILEPEDVLLLCTDGLSGIVDPQELLFEAAYGGDISTAAQRMMNIALERGAPDNVTLILLTGDPVPRTDELPG